jgi:cell division protein FtsB
MTTISIVVPGEELEQLTIELTTEEVQALYRFRKDTAIKVVELNKEIESLKRTQKYNEDEIKTARQELNQAHGLLSALGIVEKTPEVDEWAREKLNLSTRIALYLAGKTVN